MLRLLLYVTLFVSISQWKITLVLHYVMLRYIVLHALCYVTFTSVLG